MAKTQNGTNSGSEDSTIQTGAKKHESSNLMDYALFVGGLNVTNEVLRNYDPLRTGYGRLFMVHEPGWLALSIPDKLKKFKHILEYGNTAVQGIGDIEVSFNDYTGGYAGKSFSIPSVATDGTQTFTVNCYEFSGSPIREVIHTWVNGTTDLLTGLAHYNGHAATYGNTTGTKTLNVLQSNQTAEFVYVSTDVTGTMVEYACLFANCFPANVRNEQFNYTSGSHELVEYNVEFRCTKYESLQINKLGQALLNKYRVLANSLNFFSGINSSTYASGSADHPDQFYDITTGKLVTGNDGNAKTTNNNGPMTEADLASL